ncbi:hypothetical protein FI667_g2426, partial [Globisporangium splendens]
MMDPLGNLGGGNGAAANSAPSRYDDLLRQIVQLNTDLQKTAALSQTLQRERDGLQHNNGKARTVGMMAALHACLVLMQETEQKIESDKKHEELIAKWKRQLEMKARAFESLQKKFAPPKDLEQLRFKIQEELEGPHRQRVETLQDKIEKHRQFAFNMRREYEILKTEYEQFTIDQVRISGRKQPCNARRMIFWRLTIGARPQGALAANGQMAKLKDECESFRSKWDASQSKLLELTSECESLRDQMKQKDLLVFNGHNSHTVKLREERAAWEREQATLKDRVNELSLKLQAAEALIEKASTASLQAKENEISSAEYASLLKAREEEVEKYRSHTAALEKKTLEAEKEHYVAKQNSSQELVRATMYFLRWRLTRMKSECMVLRTKLKEVENDYRTLQAKHREVIQYHEDIQLEKEQMETKLKYVEQDFALLSEKLEKEKESHANSTRELQKRDAYKRKCMEVHERYKALLQETSFQESKLLQLKHDHTIELQHLLVQLSEAESEKTALMQRQIELGVPPPISTKKVLLCSLSSRSGLVAVLAYKARELSTTAHDS